MQKGRRKKRSFCFDHSRPAESHLRKIIEEFGEDAAAEAKWIPAKETEAGLYVKAQTSYSVAFYEDGIESDTVSSVDELGKGAVVDLFLSIGESKFRRDKGFTAFLSAVNVHKFGELAKFNPFA